MGRFSWGVRSKSRKETTAVAALPVPEVELGKGDATSSLTPWATPRYLWILGLCAAALFGYSMEATPARIGNAMFSNHVFSEYRAPRRLHMPLLHSRRGSLSMVSQSADRGRDSRAAIAICGSQLESALEIWLQAMNSPKFSP